MSPQDTTAHARGQNGVPRQSHEETQLSSVPGAHPCPRSQAGDPTVAKGSLGTPRHTHLAGSGLGGRALGAGDEGEGAEGAGEAGRAQGAGRAVGAVRPRGADGHCGEEQKSVREPGPPSTSQVLPSAPWQPRHQGCPKPRHAGACAA